jgi:hypothetical protein
MIFVSWAEGKVETRSLLVHPSIAASVIWRRPIVSTSWVSSSGARNLRSFASRIHICCRLLRTAWSARCPARRRSGPACKGDPKSGALGDVIVAVGGHPVHNYADFTDQLEQIGVGKTVELSIERGDLPRRCNATSVAVEKKPTKRIRLTIYRTYSGRSPIGIGLGSQGSSFLPTFSGCGDDSQGQTAWRHSPVIRAARPSIAPSTVRMGRSMCRNRIASKAGQLHAPTDLLG